MVWTYVFHMCWGLNPSRGTRVFHTRYLRFPLNCPGLALFAVARLGFKSVTSRTEAFGWIEVNYRFCVSAFTIYVGILRALNSVWWGLGGEGKEIGIQECISCAVQSHSKPICDVICWCSIL